MTDNVLPKTQIEHIRAWLLGKTYRSDLKLLTESQSDHIGARERFLGQYICMIENLLTETQLSMYGFVGLGL